MLPPRPLVSDTSCISFSLGFHQVLFMWSFALDYGLRPLLCGPPGLAVSSCWSWISIGSLILPSSERCICSSMLSSALRSMLWRFLSFMKSRFCAIYFLNFERPKPLLESRIILRMYSPAQNLPVSKSSTLFAFPRFWYISCQPSSSRFCCSSGILSN